MNNINFSFPYILLLLEIAPLMWLYYYYNYRKSRSVIQLSSFNGLKGYKKTFRQKLIHIPVVFRTVGVACLIIAIADPKIKSLRQAPDQEGTEIVYVLDASANMLATDFKPNRMEAVRSSLVYFFGKNLNSSAGMVCFAERPYIVSPITTDLDALKIKLDSIPVIGRSATSNLNAGLEAGINLLESSKAKHKYLVCLSSSSNTGATSYNQVGLHAQKTGVAILFLAVATNGYAQIPVQLGNKLIFQNTIVHLDEAAISALCKQSKGQYFRITQIKELDASMGRVTQIINRQKFTWKNIYEGIFPFALVAAVMLFLEILLRYTILKSLP